MVWPRPSSTSTEVQAPQAAPAPRCKPGTGYLGSRCRIVLSLGRDAVARARLGHGRAWCRAQMGLGSGGLGWAWAGARAGSGSGGLGLGRARAGSGGAGLARRRRKKIGLQFEPGCWYFFLWLCVCVALWFGCGVCGLGVACVAGRECCVLCGVVVLSVWVVFVCVRVEPRVSTAFFPR